MRLSQNPGREETGKERRHHTQSLKFQLYIRNLRRSAP